MTVYLCMKQIMKRRVEDSKDGKNCEVSFDYHAELSVQRLGGAEVGILKYVQFTAFSREVTSLKEAILSRNSDRMAKVETEQILR